MLGFGGPKTLAAPLMPAGKSAASPSAEDEWDCRGFEGKPLKGGVQMVHSGKVAFLTKEQINKQEAQPTWANTMSKEALDAINQKQQMLLKAIAACAFVMLVELAGGIYARSLALLSDSAHMLADIAKPPLSTTSWG